MKESSTRIFLCTGLCAVVMAGTGLTGFVDTTEAGDTQQIQGQGVRQDDRGVMTKMTAVTSSTLTVATAEKPEVQNDGTMPGKPANGETSPEKPADGGSPSEKPEDGETPLQRQEEQMGQEEMGFLGEESSLTLTSGTVVTKGTDREFSSVSHLAEGSTARLVSDGTTVVGIDILE